MEKSFFSKNSTRKSLRAVVASMLAFIMAFGSIPAAIAHAANDAYDAPIHSDISYLINEANETLDVLHDRLEALEFVRGAREVIGGLMGFYGPYALADDDSPVTVIVMFAENPAGIQVLEADIAGDPLSFSQAEHNVEQNHDLFRQELSELFGTGGAQAFGFSQSGQYEIHHELRLAMNGVIITLPSNMVADIAEFASVLAVWPDQTWGYIPELEVCLDDIMHYVGVALSDSEGRNPIGGREARARMQVDELHALGYRGQGVLIAVADSGIDYHHPAFAGSFPTITYMQQIRGHALTAADLALVPGGFNYGAYVALAIYQDDATPNTPALIMRDGIMRPLRSYQIDPADVDDFVWVPNVRVYHPAGYYYVGRDFMTGAHSHAALGNPQSPRDVPPNFFPGAAHVGTNHGTHVAGIALSRDTGGRLSTLGISPRAMGVHYRIGGPGGAIQGGAVLPALERALLDNADVINHSWGGTFQVATSPNNIVSNNMVASHGIIVVGAAGNTGNHGDRPHGGYNPVFGAIGAPGSASRALAVASTTELGAPRAQGEPPMDSHWETRTNFQFHGPSGINETILFSYPAFAARFVTHAPSGNTIPTHGNTVHNNGVMRIVAMPYTDGSYSADVPGSSNATLPIGAGTVADFEELLEQFSTSELEGAWILVRRGAPFVEVGNRARELGLGGVFSVNAPMQWPLHLPPSGTYPLFPLITISYATGSALIDHLIDDTDPDDFEFLTADFHFTADAEVHTIVVTHFSSRGPVAVSNELSPAVAAHGMLVLSTGPWWTTGTGDGVYTDSYFRTQGTSMSSPAVAGAAALLLNYGGKQDNPYIVSGETAPRAAARWNWGYDEVRARLVNTAMFVPIAQIGSFGNAFDEVPAGVFDAGAGQVNVLRAATADSFVTVTYNYAATNTGRDMTTEKGVFSFGGFAIGTERGMTATIHTERDLANYSVRLDLNSTANARMAGYLGHMDATLSAIDTTDGTFTLTLDIDANAADGYHFQGFVEVLYAGNVVARIPFGAVASELPTQIFADYHLTRPVVTTNTDARHGGRSSTLTISLTPLTSFQTAFEVWIYDAAGQPITDDRHSGADALQPGHMHTTRPIAAPGIFVTGSQLSHFNVITFVEGFQPDYAGGHDPLGPELPEGEFLLRLIPVAYVPGHGLQRLNALELPFFVDNTPPAITGVTFAGNYNTASVDAYDGLLIEHITNDFFDDNNQLIVRANVRDLWMESAIAGTSDVSFDMWNAANAANRPLSQDNLAVFIMLGSENFAYAPGSTTLRAPQNAPIRIDVDANGYFEHTFNVATLPAPWIVSIFAVDNFAPVQRWSNNPGQNSVWGVTYMPIFTPLTVAATGERFFASQQFGTLAATDDQLRGSIPAFWTNPAQWDQIRTAMWQGGNVAEHSFTITREAVPTADIVLEGADANRVLTGVMAGVPLNLATRAQAVPAYAYSTDVFWQLISVNGVTAPSLVVPAFNFAGVTVPAGQVRGFSPNLVGGFYEMYHVRGNGTIADVTWPAGWVRVDTNGDVDLSQDPLDVAIYVTLRHVNAGNSNLHDITIRYIVTGRTVVRIPVANGTANLTGGRAPAGGFPIGTPGLLFWTNIGYGYTLTVTPNSGYMICVTESVLPSGWTRNGNVFTIAEMGSDDHDFTFVFVYDDVPAFDFAGVTVTTAGQFVGFSTADVGGVREMYHVRGNGTIADVVWPAGWVRVDTNGDVTNPPTQSNVAIYVTLRHENAGTDTTYDVVIRYIVTGRTVVRIPFNNGSAVLTGGRTPDPDGFPINTPGLLFWTNIGYGYTLTVTPDPGYVICDSSILPGWTRNGNIFTNANMGSNNYDFTINLVADTPYFPPHYFVAWPIGGQTYVDMAQITTSGSRRAWVADLPMSLISGTGFETVFGVRINLSDAQGSLSLSAANAEGGSAGPITIVKLVIDDYYYDYEHIPVWGFIDDEGYFVPVKNANEPYNSTGYTVSTLPAFAGQNPASILAIYEYDYTYYTSVEDIPSEWATGHAFAHMVYHAQEYATIALGNNTWPQFIFTLDGSTLTINLVNDINPPVNGNGNGNGNGITASNITAQNAMASHTVGYIASFANGDVISADAFVAEQEFAISAEAMAYMVFEAPMHVGGFMLDIDILPASAAQTIVDGDITASLTADGILTVTGGGATVVVRGYVENYDGQDGVLYRYFTIVFDPLVLQPRTDTGIWRPIISGVFTPPGGFPQGVVDIRDMPHSGYSSDASIITLSNISPVTFGFTAPAGSGFAATPRFYIGPVGSQIGDAGKIFHTTLAAPITADANGMARVWLSSLLRPIAGGAIVGQGDGYQNIAGGTPLAPGAHALTMHVPNPSGPDLVQSWIFVVSGERPVIEFNNNPALRNPANPTQAMINGRVISEAHALGVYHGIRGITNWTGQTFLSDTNSGYFTHSNIFFGETNAAGTAFGAPWPVVNANGYFAFNLGGFDNISEPDSIFLIARDSRGSGIGGAGWNAAVWAHSNRGLATQLSVLPIITDFPHAEIALPAQGIGGEYLLRSGFANRAMEIYHVRGSATNSANINWPAGWLVVDGDTVLDAAESAAFLANLVPSPAYAASNQVITLRHENAISVAYDVTINYIVTGHITASISGHADATVTLDGGRLNDPVVAGPTDEALQFVTNIGYEYTLTVVVPSNYIIDTTNLILPTGATIERDGNVWTIENMTSYRFIFNFVVVSNVPAFPYAQITLPTHGDDGEYMIRGAFANRAMEIWHIRGGATNSANIVWPANWYPVDTTLDLDYLVIDPAYQNSNQLVVLRHINAENAALDVTINYIVTGHIAASIIGPAGSLVTLSGGRLAAPVTAGPGDDALQFVTNIGYEYILTVTVPTGYVIDITGLPTGAAIERVGNVWTIEYMPSQRFVFNFAIVPPTPNAVITVEEIGILHRNLPQTASIEVRIGDFYEWDGFASMFMRFNVPEHVTLVNAIVPAALANGFNSPTELGPVVGGDNVFATFGWAALTNLLESYDIDGELLITLYFDIADDIDYGLISIDIEFYSVTAGVNERPSATDPVDGTPIPLYIQLVAGGIEILASVPDFDRSAIAVPAGQIVGSQIVGDYIEIYHVRGATGTFANITLPTGWSVYSVNRALDIAPTQGESNWIIELIHVNDSQTNPQELVLINYIVVGRLELTVTGADAPAAGGLYPVVMTGGHHDRTIEFYEGSHPAWWLDYGHTYTFTVNVPAGYELDLVASDLTAAEYYNGVWIIEVTSSLYELEFVFARLVVPAFPIGQLMPDAGDVPAGQFAGHFAVVAGRSYQIFHVRDGATGTSALFNFDADIPGWTLTTTGLELDNLVPAPALGNVSQMLTFRHEYDINGDYLVSVLYIVTGHIAASVSGHPDATVTLSGGRLVAPFPVAGNEAAPLQFVTNIGYNYTLTVFVPAGYILDTTNLPTHAAISYVGNVWTITNMPSEMFVFEFEVVPPTPNAIITVEEIEIAFRNLPQTAVGVEVRIGDFYEWDGFASMFMRFNVPEHVTLVGANVPAALLAGFSSPTELGSVVGGNNVFATFGWAATTNLLAPPVIDGELLITLYFDISADIDPGLISIDIEFYSTTAGANERPSATDPDDGTPIFLYIQLVAGGIYILPPPPPVPAFPIGQLMPSVVPAGQFVGYFAIAAGINYQIFHTRGIDGTSALFNFGADINGWTLIYPTTGLDTLVSAPVLGNVSQLLTFQHEYDIDGDYLATVLYIVTGRLAMTAGANGSVTLTGGRTPASGWTATNQTLNFWTNFGYNNYVVRVVPAAGFVICPDSMESAIAAGLVADVMLDGVVEFAIPQITSDLRTVNFQFVPAPVYDREFALIVSEAGARHGSTNIAIEIYLDAIGDYFVGFATMGLQLIHSPYLTLVDYTLPTGMSGSGITFATPLPPTASGNIYFGWAANHNIAENGGLLITLYFDVDADAPSDYDFAEVTVAFVNPIDTNYYLPTFIENGANIDLDDFTIYSGGIVLVPSFNAAALVATLGNLAGFYAYGVNSYQIFHVRGATGTSADIAWPAGWNVVETGIDLDYLVETPAHQASHVQFTLQHVNDTDGNYTVSINYIVVGRVEATVTGSGDVVMTGGRYRNPAREADLVDHGNWWTDYGYEYVITITPQAGYVFIPSDVSGWAMTGGDGDDYVFTISSMTSAVHEFNIMLIYAADGVPAFPYATIALDAQGIDGEYMLRSPFAGRAMEIYHIRGNATNSANINWPANWHIWNGTALLNATETAAFLDALVLSPAHQASNVIFTLRHVLAANADYDVTIDYIVTGHITASVSGHADATVTLSGGRLVAPFPVAGNEAAPLQFVTNFGYTYTLTVYVPTGHLIDTTDLPTGLAISNIGNVWTIANMPSQRFVFEFVIVPEAPPLDLYADMIIGSGIIPAPGATTVSVPIHLNNRSDDWIGFASMLMRLDADARLTLVDYILPAGLDSHFSSPLGATGDQPIIFGWYSPVNLNVGADGLLITLVFEFAANELDENAYVDIEFYNIAGIEIPTAFGAAGQVLEIDIDITGGYVVLPVVITHDPAAEIVVITPPVGAVYQGQREHFYVTIALETLLAGWDGFSALDIAVTHSEWFVLTGYRVGNYYYNGDVIPNHYGISGVNADIDAGTFSWSGIVDGIAAYYRETINLITLRFEIIASYLAVSSGNHAIEVEVLNAIDTDGDDADVSDGADNVAVTQVIFGDANDDGNVTSADATWIAKYWQYLDREDGNPLDLTPPAPFNHRAADLSCDGNMGQNLLRLVYWLVGRGAPPRLTNLPQ